MSETFSITNLAEEFEVTPRTIRFYEDKNLLSPARQGLTRVYSRRDRARLILILRGRRLGFSVSDIKELLDLYDVSDGQEEQLRAMHRKVCERITALKAQRKDIDQIIKELTNINHQVETALSGDCDIGKKAKR